MKKSMKKSMKKCRVCRKEFRPHSTIQKYCGYKCAKVVEKAGVRRRRLQKKRASGKGKLDNMWKTKVKKRDNWKCVYCGKNKNVQAHHIFSRSNRSTRWYLPNGISVCVGHHLFSSVFSAHKTPIEFAEWLKERNGEEWYDDLRRQAKSVDKNDNDYWKDYLEGY